MKYLSVCSGIEAASVAWHPLGWQPVGFSEIEPFPSAVLKHHFPTIPNYGNLTEYKQWPIESGTADLLVGGCPCQAFSVAGLRKGMEDPRGNLTLTFLGLVDKLKPRWIVYENVPGLLSCNGGNDFAAFVGALGELGYGWAYRVLDAQFVGRCEMHSQGRGWDAVPQRRRRVFVVASLAGWQLAAKVLFESDSLRRNSKKGKTKGEGTTASVEDGIGKSTWWDGCQVSQTIDAVVAKQQTMPDKNRFPAILEPIVIDRASFNQGINAKYDPHIEKTETMDTIISSGPHAVLYGSNQSDGRVTGPHDIAPTVISRYGTGGGNTPLIKPMAFQPGNLSRVAGASPSDKVFPTLTKDSGDQSPHIATSMAVRRLTPMECERLQGFPDNWTQIPWKGKAAEDCPDSPRYKACGNSMAVNCMRWIGSRIDAVENNLI